METYVEFTKAYLRNSLGTKEEKIIDSIYMQIKYTEHYRDWETDRKSTRLNSSHSAKSRMPSSA